MNRESSITRRMTHDTFENVRQSSQTRDWLMGDEFLSAMMSETDTEPLIPDPRMNPEWTPTQTDAAKAAPGEIWFTQDPEVANPKVVVIRRFETETPDGAVFSVLPLSFQHQFAGPFDLVVEREESPLAVGFMIEAHSPIFTLATSLAGCVGKLTEQQFEDAMLLIPASFGLLRGERNHALRERVRWIPQGYPITRRDDIRLRFREHERENVAYLVELAERALAQLEEEPATPVVVRPLVALVERARNELRESFSDLRRLAEQVAERIAATAEDWETALAAMSPQPALMKGAGEDDEEAALEDARRRFSREEGTRIYPREEESGAVPGCCFDILPTETGYYLRILVDNPSIPLVVGALEVNDTPVFVPNVFPSTPDFRMGFVKRLPVVSEAVLEIAIPFHRQGQTDIVTIRLEPFSHPEGS